MKDCAVIPIIKKSAMNERGSAVYSFLGFVIIALVIIATVFFFPWGQVFKERQDPDYVAGEKALAVQEVGAGCLSVRQVTEIQPCKCT